GHHRMQPLPQRRQRVLADPVIECLAFVGGCRDRVVHRNLLLRQRPVMVCQSCRVSPRGSFSIRHSASSTMVARVAGSYSGQCGMSALSGTPDRANAAQVADIVAASRCAASPRSVALVRPMVSKVNGTPSAGAAFSLPPCPGVSHSNEYMNTGAPACLALCSATIRERMRKLESVSVAISRSAGLIPG